MIKRSPHTATQTDEKEFTLLLIEDSDDLRGFLEYRLSNSYDIVEAATGNEGITKVYELVPEVMLV